MRKTKFLVLIVLTFLLVLGVAAVPDGSVTGQWRDVNPDAYISPPANPQLNSVYMLSATEGWAVGDSRPTTNTTTGLPAIFHYDGSTWGLVPAPKFPDFPFKQSAYNLTSVSFGPPLAPISRNDGWAVGFNSTLSPTATSPNATALHWDGITWRVQIAGLLGSDAGPLWSVSMVSPTDAWAVGQSRSGLGVFWHWTGVPGLGGGWNEPQAPVPKILYSVAMVSSLEGWAVGQDGAIYHYFGGFWTAFSSPVSTTLRSVFMISATEGWAVGDGGVIIHYSGGTWSGPVSPGTTLNNLLSIFMVSSTEGWTLGSMGTVLHYSGVTWTALAPNLVPTSPVSQFNLTSVYFNTASDGWGVGTAGVVLHFDGSNWGTLTSPTISNFTSISFGPPLTGPVNPSDGWAVGNVSATPLLEPTIYHWNGFMWTKGVAIGAQNNLNSVFMINSGDVWTVGGGPQLTATCGVGPCPVILHYTGGSWNTLTPPAGSYVLKSVFMSSSMDGWAVGEQVASPHPTGLILHYSVSGGVGTWGIYPPPPSPPPLPPLNSVFMLQQNEGWAVGDNATILHYTVTGGIGTWSVVQVSGTPSLSPDANLTSVFMLSSTNGWAVGGIQADGSFSAGPVIIHWDGTHWTPVATPTIPGGISPTGLTSATLKSVYMTGEDDGWASGLPGKLVATLLHWDGVAWNHVNTIPALLGQVPPILSSIYMTSPSGGWIVGSDPGFTTISTKALSTILQFVPLGGFTAVTSTSTIVSTVSTSTTGIVTSVTATTTSVVTNFSTAQVTITQTSTAVTAPPFTGIPGFPVESVIAGIIVGLGILTFFKLRRARIHRGKE